ncbi:MAG: replication-associated recombination protein A [Rubinisphaera brasiliensis]|uniref:replication-associated recombination protein A n=1 Tax=Rubinisphaera brasiliensis TaxID=119 RepID=UPI0039191FCB
MAGLFDKAEQKNREKAQPLAARMRPRTLEEFAGQQQFLAEGRLLRRLLEADRLGSLIFYGPPGTGKTTLARLIARKTGAGWIGLNAASCGVKEVRAALQKASDSLATTGKRTILFVDELHHFTKTQQDVLLPELEQGTVIFIGATTDNPFFALVSALLSRSHIFEFEPLSVEALKGLLKNALADSTRGLGGYHAEVTEEALDFLAESADGDARRALSALEIAVLSVAAENERSFVDLAVAEESLQRKAIRYDKQGDEHYDAASAMIKSIRGSDPDAAIYWMARMLEAGEPPRFVARRLMISASEDIGNADPHGLVLATAAAQATEILGMPECRIPLAQAATYLACAPKSNAAYAAVNEAMDDVRNQTLLPVPRHLQDRHYAGAKRLSHGEGYQSPHQSEHGWIEQDYLGVDRNYYRPVERGYEEEIIRLMNERIRNRQQAPGGHASDEHRSAE